MNNIYLKPMSMRDQHWLSNWFRPLLRALYELGAWTAAIAASNSWTTLGKRADVLSVWPCDGQDDF